MSEFTNWKDFRKELNITPEEEAEIELEKDLIKAMIKARKKSNLTQRQLSEKSGIIQSSIAKIESLARSPQASTLIRLLYPMGYTLKVVPLDKDQKNMNQEKR